MINEQGGLNGRKLNFISLDDGYNAPKAVGQTRRLVEQEQVAFIFGQLGGFTSLAARQYLNENEKEETLMTAIDATPAKWDLSRRGFLRRSASGFAAAIAITSTGALLNVSEAWAVEVKGLKPETMRTLILIARDIYPHDKVADRFYAIAMKPYDEKAENPAMKAQIEGFVAALDAAAGPGGYVGRGWEADRVALLKAQSENPMFEIIRSGLVVSFYNQQEIWPIFGYEGESFSKGGYIKRGFDDIDWL